MNIQLIFGIILISGISSAFLVPLFEKLAFRMGLLDIPSHRKIHKTGIPLIGGAVIITSSSLAIFLYSIIQQDSNLLFAMVPVIGITILGMIDDKFDVPAFTRLMIQGISSIWVVSLLSLHFTPQVFGLELPNWLIQLFAVFFILIVTNAFNLLDGVDGLVGLVSLANFIIIMVLAYLWGNWQVLIMSASVWIPLMVFLQKNYSKKKIFLGDAGSTALGFLQAILILMLWKGTSSGNLSWLPWLLMLMPVMDLVRVVVHRYAKGKGIFSPDKSHIHHIMISIGVKSQKVGWFLMIVHLGFIILGMLLIHVFHTSLAIGMLIFAYLIVVKMIMVYSDFEHWIAYIKKIEQNQII